MTHWAHWNLLRPVLDARERSKWVDALRKAGLVTDTLDKLELSEARSNTVYHREADELGLPGRKPVG